MAHSRGIWVASPEDFDPSDTSDSSVPKKVCKTFLLRTNTE